MFSNRKASSYWCDHARIGPGWPMSKCQASTTFLIGRRSDARHAIRSEVAVEDEVGEENVTAQAAAVVLCFRRMSDSETRTLAMACGLGLLSRVRLVKSNCESIITRDSCSCPYCANCFLGKTSRREVFQHLSLSPWSPPWLSRAAIIHLIHTIHVTWFLALRDSTARLLRSTSWHLLSLNAWMS